MLNIRLEDVCSIIQLAQQFHAKESVVFPDEGETSADDWAMQVLADHAQDPTYQELKYEIEALDPDEQLELVALMWVGRGDYGVDEWEEALAQARDGRTTGTADYLISTPLVADYLEEGLAEFGLSCEED